MTLRIFWNMIRRWRWIVIAGLVVGLAGGAFGGVATPVTYQVQASYLFLSPVLAGDGKPGNPFLQLGNSVSTTVDILAVALEDGVMVDRYVDENSDLTYTARRDTSLAAPLMNISVEDISLDSAAATLSSLGIELGRRLDYLQQEAGAPVDQWITMSQFTSDPKPVLDYSAPIRNGVASALGALLLSLGIVLLAERRRLVGARKTRLPAHSESEASLPPADESSPSAEYAPSSASELARTSPK